MRTFWLKLTVTIIIAACIFPWVLAAASLIYWGYTGELLNGFNWFSIQGCFMLILPIFTAYAIVLLDKLLDK